MSTSNSNTNTSSLTPGEIAKKLSEIIPANTKETIEETKKYLSTQKLDLDGYRQIWKGIFFAMWASDKVPVQQALADELSNLIFSVYKLKVDAIHLWIQACFNIMNKEWLKIDYWRVNKFSSFMRKIITAFIRYLRKKGFNIDYVRQFNKTIHQELYVEVTQTVGGLALHVMQIYPEILSNFTKANHEQVTQFLELFLKQLSSSACKNLRQKIKECIFDKIVELKTEQSSFQNLNMKAYREKLFEIAKKKKTDDISRKELYEVIELIDAKVNLDEEEERYTVYQKNKEENKLKVQALKEANGQTKDKKNKDKKEQPKKKDTQNQKETSNKKETTNKKEEKINKKEPLVQEEPSKQKKQKLSELASKLVENKSKQTETKKEQPEQNDKKPEEKLTKKQKKDLKIQDKLLKMIEEEEKKLNQAEQKLSKKQQKNEKSAKTEAKDLKKQLLEAENEDDDEENDQDWDEEEEDEDYDENDGADEDEDDDEEDYEDVEGEEGDEEIDLGEYEEGDFDMDDELDEEEIQMLLKSTPEDIEVDDMDDDFYGEDDFEGYDVAEVLGNPQRINGLQSVYNSLPEYHFLSDPQKIKYFNNLTTKFKSNLQKEKLNGCSHKKTVVINTNNNLIKGNNIIFYDYKLNLFEQQIEFDFNEEVIAITKAPVMKKAKKAKIGSN